MCKEGLEGDGINFCFNCTQCHKDTYCDAPNRRCICRTQLAGNLNCDYFVPKGSKKT